MGVADVPPPPSPRPSDWPTQWRRVYFLDNMPKTQCRGLMMGWLYHTRCEKHHKAWRGAA